MKIGSSARTLMWWTRARGRRPCVFTARSDATSSADAPSEIWLDTAAVRRPPGSSGWSFAIFSRLVSRRGPSSLRDVAERRDLALEAPLVDRADRALVALEREALHVLARDVPLLGDHLGAAELRHLLRAVARDPALRARERIREAERLRERHRRRDRDRAHVLHAARDDEIAWCRSSPPARRSAPTAATSRTGGRSSRRARARAAPPRASRCARCRRPAGRSCRSSRRSRPRRRPGRRRCAPSAPAARARRGRRSGRVESPPPRLPTGRAHRVDDVGLGHGLRCLLEKVVPGSDRRAAASTHAATRGRRWKARVAPGAVERPGAPHPEVQILLPGVADRAVAPGARCARRSAAASAAASFAMRDVRARARRRRAPPSGPRGRPAGARTRASP